MFLAVSLSSGLLQMHSQALITDPTTQALNVPFPPLKMWAVGMQVFYQSTTQSGILISK